MDSDDPELSPVLPGRHDETRRRVNVLTTYLKAPSVAAATSSAAELGLSLSSFYMLARAWKAGGAAAIPGAGKPRNRRDTLSDEQRDIIRKIAGRSPKPLLQRAIEDAMKLGASRGVAMPSAANLRLQLRKAMGPRLDEDSFAQGSTFVVDHVAVDIPIRAGELTIMPIAAVVLSAVNGSVLGVNLTLDGPSPTSVASAVVAAAAAFIMPSAISQVLAIETFDGDGWASLLDDLARLPCLVRAHHRHLIGRTGPAATLMPDRISGIAVRPRLVTRDQAGRSAKLPAGSKPLTLDEANRLIRARWLPR